MTDPRIELSRRIVEMVGDLKWTNKDPLFFVLCAFTTGCGSPACANRLNAIAQPLIVVGMANTLKSAQEEAEEYRADLRPILRLCKTCDGSLLLLRTVWNPVKRVTLRLAHEFSSDYFRIESDAVWQDESERRAG